MNVNEREFEETILDMNVNEREFEETILDMNVNEREFEETILDMNVNEREFEETILDMNWNEICKSNQNDPGLSFHNFLNSITYQLDEFAPLKKVARKEYNLMSKPWISKEILEKCRTRDDILRNVSGENDPIVKDILRNDYRKLRNEVTKDKRDSNKGYCTAFFQENQKKSSKIWEGIRSLVNIKATKSPSIKLLDENDNLVSDPKIISNLFHHYFATVGPEIERNIPFVPGSFKDYFSKKD